MLTEEPFWCLLASPEIVSFHQPLNYYGDFKKTAKIWLPTQLLVDGVGLERVSKFKYLGVWFSDT